MHYPSERFLSSWEAVVQRKVESLNTEKPCLFTALSVHLLCLQ